MQFKVALVLNTILFCNAKLLRMSSGSFTGRQANGISFPDDQILSTELAPRTLQSVNFVPIVESVKTKRIAKLYTKRTRRSTAETKTKRSLVDSKTHESSLIWAHSERLDEVGDFFVRWVTSDTSITFRVEAKTKGYVGVGFNSAGTMKGADLVVAWVDDRSGNAQILDCHGAQHGDGSAITDDTQNYELVSGYQNNTHTTIEFRRHLDTCDVDDFVIGDDTTQVLWALGPDGSDGQLPKHSVSGSRPLRLLLPVPKPESIPLKHWDVRLNNLKIPHNMATLFWCKIFKTPDLPVKHHIVGYQPIIDSQPIVSGAPSLEKNSLSPVHHMVLYECAEDPSADIQIWNGWAEGDGYFGPSMPREWASCLTPIAAWAMGSKGEFLPENVGIPFGDKGGVTYYMLEVHYDNEALHEVLDSSGIRVHYTSALRQHDAAFLGSGVAVSALHIIPPGQAQYNTVGICNSHCSENMIPEGGINIVSVLLHAHGTAKKISLKHIRGDQELPRISEENLYDSRYQQSRVVPGGRKFHRGDTLLTECTYDSRSRTKPILGGYSAQQEMCLSFVLYYPRTQLAGCYSMTPVKEFFEAFGVREFYNIDMMQVENLFLSSGSLDSLPQLSEFDIQRQQNVEETAMQGDDQGVGLLKALVIREPFEFRNKSFIAHLNEIPWSEPLLTKRIEDRLYKGTHMTFCKKRDDNLAIPVEIQNFPNYTEVISNETMEKSCHYKIVQGPSATKSASGSGNMLTYSRTILINTVVLISFIYVAR